MPISYSEYARLSCPSCRTGFAADVWTLIDAAERPDLAEALRDERLNIVDCPSCGFQGPAGAPLLYHEPAQRRVYFAVPPDVDEHRWREQAQALLYVLVGSLPEDARLPYLGDVQVEHELAGVRRAVLRRERGRRPGAPAQPPVGRSVEAVIGRTPAPAPPLAPSPAPADDTAELVEAVRALVAADTPAEFAAIVAANPALLGEPGDALIEQLATIATQQGEPAVAAALREARAGLARLRAGGPLLAPAADPTPDSGPAPGTPAPPSLPDPAYQALLRVASPAALAEAARAFPALLEAWADDDLAARTEAALEEGNERLAQALDERREALAELHTQTNDPATLLAAVRALMEAEDDDAIADVLTIYPLLLTDTAQEALLGLAAGARAQGDDDLAEYAIGCRALLRQVRAGLEG